MINLGDVIPLHLATITFPDTHPLAGQDGAIFGFVILHPSGPVIFETGFGRNSPFMDNLYKVHHRPIEEELARSGIARNDIHAIVNSHLHFDHCGSNYLFPGVPIYVQAEEHRAAHEPNYTVPKWVDFPEADYRQIEGDREIAPGLQVISTRGHTRGHQSLVVETSGGTVVLAGQAIYSKAEFDYIGLTGSVPDGDPQLDPENYLASAQRLIRLSARRVYFSHDAAIHEAATE